MVVHVIKVFLAGAFAAAAAMRAVLSSLGWIDSHTALPTLHVPALLSTSESQVALCAAAGALFTVWVERARRHRV